MEPVCLYLGEVQHRRDRSAWAKRSLLVQSRGGLACHVDNGVGFSILCGLVADLNWA